MLGAFLAAGALKLATHEMWRDELQAWMIARASRSPRELLANLDHEAHPPLWHGLLFLVSRLTADPRAMQVLHLAVATATVAVVLRWAPFPAWQRRLFAFGYFPFFEYLNISRGYALGLLGLVVACALASRPVRSWPAIGVALGVLALSSLHGLVVALAVAAALVVDEVGRGRRSVERAVLVGAGLFAVAVVLAAATTAPPPDYAFGPGRPDDALVHRAEVVTGDVWRALAPFPPLKRHFWNANILDDAPRPATVMGVLGAALAVAVAAVLARRRQWAWLALWASGTGALLALSFVAYHGYLRHAGHLFLVLLAVAWLAHPQRIGRESGRQGGRCARRFGGSGALGALFAAVLVVQAAAGVAATAGDLALPFSNSRWAADVVAGPRWSRAALVGDVDFAASAVAAWVDRPVRYPRAGRSGTFVVWDRRRECRLTPAACVTPTQLVADARRALAAGAPAVLLVLNYPIGVQGAELVASRTGAVQADEDFWLYEVRR